MVTHKVLHLARRKRAGKIFVLFDESFLVYLPGRKDIFMPKSGTSTTKKVIRLFTSESVCAGHPDKICDAISDAIVDAALAQDPHSRTGIETVAGANQISLYGEIKTLAKIDYEDIVRKTVDRLGYTVPEWGFSQESIFSNDIHQQSPEIALGVDQDGAGDQGMMFGYACRETAELMPLPIALAHALTRRIDEVRETGALKWLRPDGKAQVTIRYEDDKPVAVEKIVAAVAHDEATSPEQVRADIIREVF
jgi:S-adenosylmethionine synthetase